MKKLFFVALLATVAVGGAYAQYFSPGSTSQDVDCGTTVANCQAQYGFQYAYTVGGTIEEQEAAGPEAKIDLSNILRDL